MEDHKDRIKQVLEFLLSSYRAKLAIQNPSSSTSCPFDFQAFLSTWRGKYESWDALKVAIKDDLQPLVDHGIFDSIVPYLASSVRNNTRGIQDKPSNINETIISTELVSLTPASSSRRRHKHPSGPEEGQGHDRDRIEITIHVCDEAKNIRQDFRCVQSILLKEMGYFSKVTVKGQKLRDMDISVHCDIDVFDWLMQWVKVKAGIVMTGENEEVPKLSPTNVIGLLVSAEFLQMPTLVSECLSYTANNLEEIILRSPNLGCLNESLTRRLATLFTPLEMEERIIKVDLNDRITSRVYTQFTVLLNEEEKTEERFGSSRTLFRCLCCGQLLTNGVAPNVPCVPSNVRLDSWGRLYSIHTPDRNWSLVNYIRETKRELRTWRKVYWRVWGSVNFLWCLECKMLFPLRDYGGCRYHPKPPQLQIKLNSSTGEILERNLDEEDDSSVGDQEEEEICINPFRLAKREKELQEAEQENSYETINCGFGLYPCCRKEGFRLHPLPQRNGCQIKDHVPLIRREGEGEVFNMFEMFRDLIALSPKELKSQGKLKQDPRWGGIGELSPPKMQMSTTGSGSRSGPSGRNTKRELFITLKARQASISTSTESSTEGHPPEEEGEEDEEDEEVPPTIMRGVSSSYYSSSNYNQDLQYQHYWNWNPEFTTRYNQDMQREREEKLMADLEFMLSRRVSLDNTGGGGGGSNSVGGGSYHLSSVGSRFGYLSRRTPKNFGGSFLRLEERWKEDHNLVNQTKGTSSTKGRKSAKIQQQ